VTYPTFSRDQLVTRALRVLNVVPNGQSPDDDDYDTVDAFVEPLFARLNAEGITSNTDFEGNVTELDDPESVPAKMFLDVAVLLAEAALSDFGLSALPPPNDRTASEMRLRTVMSTGPTMEEAFRVDPYPGVETTGERFATLQGEYF
jgi:hypothetical protein